MRIFPIAVITALLTIFTLPPVPSNAQSQDDIGEYRTFTDSQGRTIQARLIEIDGNNVTLQRSDGRKFTVSISSLSAKDKAQLRQPSADLSKSSVESDWPAFRGPKAMGSSDATGLPLHWNATQNVLWKTELPGAGASTPIVIGDRIFLTAYTGYFVPNQPGGDIHQLKRHLLAISMTDGRVLWDKPIAAKLPEEESIRDHGFAASSVAGDQEQVYVFFGKTGVFSFDHDGNQIWHADVGSNTNGWGSAASPVLYKDLVFINASVESESLIALDRKTGKERWRAGGVGNPNSIREAWNTPLIVTADTGRDELVIPTAGTVYSFDPLTGQQLWSCKTDIAWYMVPSAIAANGVIYCLGGRSGTAALAIRAGGSGDVTDTHRLWTSQSGSNVSSPVYHDGHLYWAHESREIAYCIAAESGETVYEKRLPRSGQFYASTLLADGRLYYLSRSGKTFVLAAKPSFEQLAMNELSDSSVFNASPVVSGNRLLLRSDKFLYCIEEN